MAKSNVSPHAASRKPAARRTESRAGRALLAERARDIAQRAFGDAGNQLFTEAALLDPHGSTRTTLELYFTAMREQLELRGPGVRNV